MWQRRAFFNKRDEKRKFLNICLHIPLGDESVEGREWQGAWGVFTPKG